MELYEIVKTEIIERHSGYYDGKTSVITATMDKDLAEQMLSIYKSNQSSNESYSIRTLREPKVEHLNYDPISCERCPTCNGYTRCLLTILENPKEMIRCMYFGRLKEYKTKRMIDENA